MKPLTREKISEIKTLLSSGHSLRQIATKVGVGYATVQRAGIKYRTGGTVNKAGASQKLSSRVKNFIVRGFEDGFFVTSTSACQYVLEVFNKTVSGQTIRNILKDAGLKSYVKTKKPRLTAQHKKARLAYARKMKNAPESFWKYTIFTDESKYNLYGPDGHKRVWRRQKCQLQDHHIRKVVKFGGGSVTVWGCITYRGVGKLIFIDGRMNAEMFISVLSSGLTSTLDMHCYDLDEVFLQQDNDSKHTSLMAREFIRDADIQLLPWPSCSPDLNPIEHLWNDVEIRIRDRQIQPKNITELMEVLQEEWYKTPSSYIQTLFDSMPRRIEAVIKARGGYTKY